MNVKATRQTETVLLQMSVHSSSPVQGNYWSPAFLSPKSTAVKCERKVFIIEAVKGSTESYFAYHNTITYWAHQVGNILQAIP